LGGEGLVREELAMYVDGRGRGYLISALAVLLLLGCWSSASAQTLAEIAEKEKARRQTLQEQESQSEAAAPGGSAEASAPGGNVEAPADRPVEPEADPLPEESDPGPEITPALQEEVEPPSVVSGSQAAPSGAELFLRGSYSLDWFRTSYGDGLSSGQLSNRLKLETGRRPGDGWRMLVDVRDRLDNGGEVSNMLIVYDARLIYDRSSNPFTFAAGQMGLYDTVGVGQLLGGLLGYRVSPGVTVGGYAGLEPEIYGPEIDTSYQKYGAYAQFYGSGATSASVSYNALRFDGMSERQYLHSSALLPFAENGMFYGNLEYELSSRVASQDRLSTLFLNARYDITDSVDVTANYTSGRGLDYHRFLLEQSQEPGLNDAELERFYYSTQFGARLGVQPTRSVRVFVELGRNEQKDLGIQNDTTTFGGSVWDLADSGVSVYGSYRLNRGDASESDSYRLSFSRDFGLVSWTVYYSSVFNGVRFDPVTGAPSLVRIPDRKTLSNDLFFALSRSVGVSFEYEYSAEDGPNANAVFFRFIYRL
jgi:hypothetical protein